MTLVAVASHARHYGFDGVRENVKEGFEVLELREALTRHYKTDAHLVAYVVADARRQPRINKGGLPHFGRPVEMGVFFADVDNPGHASWTDKLLDEAMQRYEHTEILQTVGIYHTAHGARFVQPIEEPIPVEEVEPYLRRWHLELADAGIDVDFACKDWTRHYRLPNIIRDGRTFVSPFIDLDRMQTIAIAPLPKSTFLSDSTAPELDKSPKPVPAVQWSADIPSFWRDRVKTIAEAVCEVHTEWHTLFMAIAGALLSRGVPHELVPALNRAISHATGRDTRPDDREAAARTTVQRKLSGQPTTGYRQLAQEWPSVAMALDLATATGVQARVTCLDTENASEPALSLQETKEDLEETIRNAPIGVTLISAECGLGKTEAAIKIATERAAKEHASPNATGQRAPLQSKTAISVDKNALAEQVFDRFAELGVPAKRFFGPLSVKRADGTPECHYAKIAEPLVAGGQSMQRELCEG